MTDPPSLRVATFPSDDMGNPYFVLLHERLASRGVIFVRGALTPGWALRGPRCDVVHVHWLEFIVNASGGLANRHPRLAPVAMAVRAARLLVTLAILRTRRIRVVWTVHNLAPHESTHPRIYAATVRGVLALGAAPLFHSQHAWRTFRSRYGGRPRRAWLTPHGNYESTYPPSNRSREQVRADLGLPEDAFMLLSFGQLRPYKRVEDSIAAVRASTDPRMHLVVAGAPLDDATRASITAAAGSDSRIVLRLDRIPDGEVADLHLAADAALIGYRDVFSSGVLLLALTFDLPAVVPADSTATEYAPAPATEAFEEGGLPDALRRMADSDRSVRRQAARAASDALDWGTTADCVRAAYDDREAVLAEGATP